MMSMIRLVCSLSALISLSVGLSGCADLVVEPKYVVYREIEQPVSKVETLIVTKPVRVNREVKNYRYEIHNHETRNQIVHDHAPVQQQQLKPRSVAPAQSAYDRYQRSVQKKEKQDREQQQQIQRHAQVSQEAAAVARSRLLEKEKQEQAQALAQSRNRAAAWRQEAQAQHQVSVANQPELSREERLRRSEEAALRRSAERRIREAQQEQ